jgi:hypothetical protein
VSREPNNSSLSEGLEIDEKILYAYLEANGYDELLQLFKSGHFNMDWDKWVEKYEYTPWFPRKAELETAKK